VDVAGEYVFRLTSDDGSRASVGGKVVVSHDGRHGVTAKAGGWGHQLGDQGSGYAIGYAGLRESIRQLEQTGRVGALGRRLLKKVGLQDSEAWVGWMQSVSKREVAALAPLDRLGLGRRRVEDGLCLFVSVFFLGSWTRERGALRQGRTALVEVPTFLLGKCSVVSSRVLVGLLLGSQLGRERVDVLLGLECHGTGRVLVVAEGALLGRAGRLLDGRCRGLQSQVAG
jgi:hypothetical protein